MLAPRKTLWSTPDPVIDRLFESIPLTGSDRVSDIGCGDGRVLLRWAILCSQQLFGSSTESDERGFPSFLGIDIDPTRIDQAQQQLIRAQKDGSLDRRIDVSFLCANALDCRDRLEGTTVYFLYLIPRGLRIVKPMILQFLDNMTAKGSRDSQRIHVITYMSPLENEEAHQTDLIQVPHQPGASWPLYFYIFEKKQGS